MNPLFSFFFTNLLTKRFLYLLPGLSRLFSNPVNINMWLFNRICR